MVFYYILSIGLLALIVFLICSFILRKRNIPEALFAEALKNENSGHFEEAVLTYENALDEEKKARFHSTTLKNKITEKIKVLHTNIEYKKGLHVTR